jgi:hypothetical protein
LTQFPRLRKGRGSFRFSYFYEIQGQLGPEEVGKEVKVSCTADFRFAKSLSTVVQFVPDRPCRMDAAANFACRECQPMVARTKLLGLFAKTNHSFAGFLQLPFHGRNCLSSSLKATRSIPATNRSIFSILATISRNGAEGFLKGKYRLSFGPLLDRPFDGEDSSKVRVGDIRPEL